MSLLPSRGPETSTAQEGELEVVGVDEEVAPVIDALSSDTAREVLNAIYAEPGTPSDIADRLDMSIQKVSYHLENLAAVELIESAGTRYSEKGQEMTVYEPPDEPLVLFVGTEDRKRTLRSLVKRVVPTLSVLAVASAAVQSIYGGGPGLGLGGGEVDTSGEVEPAADGGDAPADGGSDLGPESTGGGGGGDTATAEGPGIAADGGDGMTGTPQPTEAPQDTGVPDATTTPRYDSSEGGSIQAEEATRIPPETEAPSTLVPETPDGVVDGVAAIEPGLAFFLGGLFVLALVGAVWYASGR